MALILKDRISETTTTSGTGTITLAGARVGFQGFSAIGDGNTTYYCITDGAAWEVGLGTYTSTGNTLARTTVYSNSNGNTSPITLTVGTKNVFSPMPADGIITVNGSTIQVPGSAILPVANGGTGANTLTSNNVILGNGTSAVQFVAPGTSSNVLTSNGTTWVSQAAGGGGGGTPTVNQYDSGTGATWTKPGSANWVLIEIWGGGGSGGRGNTNWGAGGGGGGAYNSALIPFADLQGAVTYTVGAGGASRTTAGVGNVGGTSQVDMATFAGGGTKSLFAYGGGGGGGATANGGSGGGGGGQLGAGQVGAVQTTTNRSEVSTTAFGGSGGGPGGGLGTRTFGASQCPPTLGTPILAGNGSSGGGGGGVGTGGSPTIIATNLVNSAWAGAGSIYGGGGGGGGGNLGSSSATINTGGSSLYGGGGGGGCNASNTAGNGGSSVWGGAGSAGTTASTASSDGTLPAGGSGGTEAANSGNGGGGRVRFTYW